MSKSDYMVNRNSIDPNIDPDFLIGGRISQPLIKSPNICSRLMTLGVILTLTLGLLIGVFVMTCTTSGNYLEEADNCEFRISPFPEELLDGKDNSQTLKTPTISSEQDMPPFAPCDPKIVAYASFRYTNNSASSDHDIGPIPLGKVTGLILLIFGGYWDTNHITIHQAEARTFFKFCMQGVTVLALLPLFFDFCRIAFGFARMISNKPCCKKFPAICVFPFANFAAVTACLLAWCLGIDEFINLA